MVHRDIIIIGAGLSGIGAACHLYKRTPTKPILFSRPEPKLAVLGVYFNIRFDQILIYVHFWLFL
jgi:thioredoxin reductase